MHNKTANAAPFSHIHLHPNYSRLHYTFCMFNMHHVRAAYDSRSFIQSAQISYVSMGYVVQSFSILFIMQKG